MQSNYLAYYRLKIDDSLPYAIVGDDIVMDAKYTESYLEILQELDVPISVSKSLFNAKSAEFCSVFIHDQKIYHSYKWRKPSDNNFVDIAKVLGPKAMGLFRPQQRQILDLIAPLPSQVGGLGWNTEGKSIATRIFENFEIYEALSSDDEVLATDKLRVYRKLAYTLGLYQPPKIDSEEQYEALTHFVGTRTLSFDEVKHRFGYLKHGPETINLSLTKTGSRSDQDRDTRDGEWRYLRDNSFLQLLINNGVLSEWIGQDRWNVDFEYYYTQYYTEIDTTSKLSRASKLETLRQRLSTFIGIRKSQGFV